MYNWQLCQVADIIHQPKTNRLTWRNIPVFNGRQAITVQTEFNKNEEAQEEHDEGLEHPDVDILVSDDRD
ncbi:hypothetical protein N0V95_004366 [Ascochyta clinopodiicola]|nr:hypothetical protein N0V95_004366 [Ascochyta clinopodiicola]